MGEELVGVVEVVAEEVGVDFQEVGSSFAAVEEVENPPFHLPAASSAAAHVILRVGLS